MKKNQNTNVILVTFTFDKLLTFLDGLQCSNQALVPEERGQVFQGQFCTKYNKNSYKCAGESELNYVPFIYSINAGSLGFV